MLDGCDGADRVYDDDGHVLDVSPPSVHFFGAEIPINIFLPGVIHSPHSTSLLAPRIPTTV